MNESVGVKQRGFADGDIQRTLLVLAAWFFLAVWLGVTGKLVTTGGLPIGLGAAIVLPLIVFAVDGRFGHPLFGGLMRLDLPGADRRADLPGRSASSSSSPGSAGPYRAASPFRRRSVTSRSA